MVKKAQAKNKIKSPLAANSLRDGIVKEDHEDVDDSYEDDSEAASSVYSDLSGTEDETSSNASNDEDDDDDDDEDAGHSHVVHSLKKNGDEIRHKLSKVKEKQATLAGPVPLSETLNAPTDEYEYDSSDEEDIRNTVGNIPMEWYDDYRHLGYDWDGKRIMKPKSSDQLDKFLTRMEDPNYWKTVHDPSTGRDVVLSNKDVELIHNIQKGKYPEKNYDPYAPWIDFFSYDTMIHAVTNQPEHKRSFVPSYIEKRKVSKLVHAIKMGYYKPKPKKSENDEPEYYLIWDKQESAGRRLHNQIPAPKMKLPGHEESYNPPPEYILNEEEEERWKNQEPEDRRMKFLPQKYGSLREVPAYDNFIRERFERCLDLYLCPRQQKMRMNIDPEDLIPKLPKPKDLQPFPSALTLVYRGHSKMVKCLTVEPFGQFMASGSDDGTVRIWEILTGRCFATIKVDGPVRSIAWCPNNAICTIAVAVNKSVIMLNPKVGDKMVINNTDLLLTPLDQDDKVATSGIVQWRTPTNEEHEPGCRIIIDHPKDVRQVTWHCKGDYFSTVMDDAGNKSVLIHQLTKRHSQQPFSRPKGLVQCVLFHPTRPYFFVATQRYVRIYNLIKQELSKKLLTNSKWVSSIAVHSGGDNLIIGTYDCRLSWFDLDLSTKPYQTLRHHKKALRQVVYHRRYPLFASASDDGSVIICHGMVHNDLLQNALIVPVKVLKGHETRDGLSVLDCQFHPTQPWIFTAGADGNIFFYT